MKLKPSDPVARGLLGYLELRQEQNVDEATSDLEAAVKLDPKNMTNQSNLASAYLQQQKWAQAIPILRLVEASKPGDGFTGARLAGALAETGDLTDSLPIYAKIVKFPNCPEAVIKNYALTLARDKQYAAAAAEYDKVAAMDPTDAAAWDSAGICYATIGKQQDAVSRLAVSLKLGPEDPYRTRFLYATALAETGQNDAAVKQFKYVTVLKPDEFAGWYNLGLVEERMGHVPDAIAAYQQARQLAPDNTSTLLNLAGLLVKSGEVADAVDELSGAVQQQPTNAALHRGLATAYLAQQNSTAAETELKTALTIDPADDLTRAELAQLYSTNKDWPNALAEYQILSKVAPDSDALQNQLGETLEQLKRYSDALPYLQRAIEINPKNAIAWNDLGAVHEQTGQLPEALADYKKAVALDPSMVEAQSNAGRLGAAMQSGTTAKPKPALATSTVTPPPAAPPGPAPALTTQTAPLSPKSPPASGTISP